MENCEQLSPAALEIFEKIKLYFPPDPWGQLQWTPEGKVYSNGWHDLRLSATREYLIHRYEHTIGNTITTFSSDKVLRGEELTKEVFNLEMYKKWIELVTYLRELDFQIETLDFIGD